jgi:preprotein translocase subunit SecF
MLSIATGLITAYAFVRLGWTSAIPVLVSLVSILAVTIGTFVICQVYFDTDVVIAISAVFLIGTYFIFMMVNNINNK